jgi:hypothetical protein
VLVCPPQTLWLKNTVLIIHLVTALEYFSKPKPNSVNLYFSESLSSGASNWELDVIEIAVAHP